MRIAITTATDWPDVQRGGERFVNELAAFLAGRNHEVTVLSAGPAPGEIARHHGYVTRRHRRWWHPAFARIGWHEAHAFVASVAPALLRGCFDVVQSTSFLDTFTATLTRRTTGAASVFWVNSVPTPVKYIRSLSLGGGVFRYAMRNADEVIALSAYVREYLVGRFDRGGIVLPIPVDTDRFRPIDRPWRPSIVCAARLDDERKGGRLLMRAFNGVKPVWPDAELHVHIPLGGGTRERLLAEVQPSWRGDVRFGEVSPDAMPRAFAGAAVSVLPSLWESFGMVVLESMACGTPVVGTRHGALPELIPDPSIGRLFDPGPLDGAAASNVAGLTTALLEALDLSRLRETRARCRAWAERFSWSTVGPEFESLYDRVILGRRRAGTYGKLTETRS